MYLERTHTPNTHTPNHELVGQTRMKEKSTLGSAPALAATADSVGYTLGGGPPSRPPDSTPVP